MSEDDDDKAARRDADYEARAYQELYIDQKIKVGDIVQIQSMPHITRDVWHLGVHTVDLHGNVKWNEPSRTFEEGKTYQCLVIRKDHYDRHMDILFDETPVRFMSTLLAKMSVQVIT